MHEAFQPLTDSRKLRRPIQHDETRHCAASEYQVEIVLRTCGQIASFIAANTAAYYHPGTRGDARKHIIQYRTADIVEDHVHPARAMFLDLFAYASSLVINGRIITCLFDQPFAFFRSTSDSNCPATSNLCKLAD